MNKRNLATFLWFMVGWTVGAVVAFVAGLPSALALVVGVGLAAIVRWDPTGLLWSRSAAARRIRPINEFAAELDKRVDSGMDKRIDHWPVVETDTQRV